MRLQIAILCTRLSSLAILLTLPAFNVSAQTKPNKAATAQGARITQGIDETQNVQLKGNVHPLAKPEFDQGSVEDATPMNRMLLVLQRSPEQQAALQKLMQEQLSKDSPKFHKWLTPQQFGQQFGPADVDIEVVKSWLAAHGFRDIKLAVGRTAIEFSGTAGQVRGAFQTEIHRFLVDSETH